MKYLSKRRKFILVLIISIEFLFPTIKFIDWNKVINHNKYESLTSIRSSSELITKLNEIKINDYTTSNQDYPSINTITSNSFVTAWQSDGQDGDGLGIYAKMIDVTTGNDLIAEFKINDYITSDQSRPSICGLSSNSLAIAWYSDGQDGSGRGVYAKIIDVTTGNDLIAEFQVNDYTTGNQANPYICALSSNSFVTAWQSNGQDGDGLGVYAKVIDATTGNDLIAEFQVNDYISDTQSKPSICALSSNSFAISWHSDGQDGSGRGVYAKVIDATTGNDLIAEFQVNDYTTDNQAYPSICALSSNSFAISWHSDGQDGSGRGVYAKVIDTTTGNDLISEFQVNDHTTSNQSHPSICTLSRNSFAISWHGDGQDGDGLGVYAKVIDATTGNDLIAEFQVNDYISDTQSHPSICTLSSNSFAISWHSYGQDGNGSGVYTKVISTSTSISNFYSPNIVTIAVILLVAISTFVTSAIISTIKKTSNKKDKFKNKNKKSKPYWVKNYIKTYGKEPIHPSQTNRRYRDISNIY